jgi:hypothetical protein
MAGEQPQAEGYNWVVPSNQRTSWAMRKLVSLLLLLTESQGSGATLGSLNLLPQHHATTGRMDLPPGAFYATIRRLGLTWASFPWGRGLAQAGSDESGGA